MKRKYCPKCKKAIRMSDNCFDKYWCGNCRITIRDFETISKKQAE